MNNEGWFKSYRQYVQLYFEDVLESYNFYDLKTFLEVGGVHLSVVTINAKRLDYLIPYVKNEMRFDSICTDIANQITEVINSERQ